MKRILMVLVILISIAGTCFAQSLVEIRPHFLLDVDSVQHPIVGGTSVIYCQVYTNPPNSGQSYCEFSSYLNQYSHMYKNTRLAVYDDKNRLLLQDSDFRWSPIEGEYQELLNYILSNNL